MRLISVTCGYGHSAPLNVLQYYEDISMMGTVCLASRENLLLFVLIFRHKHFNLNMYDSGILFSLKTNKVASIIIYIWIILLVWII